MIEEPSSSVSEISQSLEALASSPADDPWPRRFTNIVLVFLIVSLLASWVLAGYFGQSVNAGLSFRAADGWCDAAKEGVGVHCFGDFYYLIFLSKQATVWGSAYTPTAMIPHIISNFIAENIFGGRVTLFLYLGVLSAALLAPALFIAHRASGVLPRLGTILVFGVGTLPFLIAMDRGNSVGFAVPWLLAFAIYLDRKPTWIAPLAIVCAACVRPQFILLSVGLLAIGRIKHTIVVLAGFGLTLLISFALWPGDRLENFRRWMTNIKGYSRYQDVNLNSPANLSAAHAVTVVGRILRHTPRPFADAGTSLIQFVTDHPSLPGLILVAITVVVLYAARTRISRPLVMTISLALTVLFPGVSYPYYLVFTLIIAALIVTPTGRADSPLRTAEFSTRHGLALLSDTPKSGGPGNLWCWGLILVTALSIAPIPFVLATGRNDAVLENLGLIWLLLYLWTLWMAMMIAIRHVRRRQDAKVSADGLDLPRAASSSTQTRQSIVVTR